MAPRRVLVKLSGERLANASGWGVDGTALAAVAREIQSLVKKGLRVAVVLGGGNFWRFRDQQGLSISRPTSDAIGMLATLMNGRLLAEALQNIKIPAQVLSAHGDGYFAELYSPQKGRAGLDQKQVVICVGGTGNPFFTTDTAAALRALELGCELLLKSTQVEGVYSADPRKNPKAKLFTTISYEEVLERELQVMDLTAIVLCKENRLPVVVFNGSRPGNLLKAATGQRVGTRIH